MIANESILFNQVLAQAFRDAHHHSGAQLQQMTDCMALLYHLAPVRSQGQDRHHVLVDIAVVEANVRKAAGHSSRGV